MLYVKGRGTDKTTKALRLAAAMGVPLLVPDKVRARSVGRMNYELKLKVEVITVDELSMYRRGCEPIKLVIDDADEVLRHLLGVDVLLATMTGEEAEIELSKL
jgi:hypothetical protein